MSTVETKRIVKNIEKLGIDVDSSNPAAKFNRREIETIFNNIEMVTSVMPQEIIVGEEMNINLRPVGRKRYIPQGVPQLKPRRI